MMPEKNLTIIQIEELLALPYDSAVEESALSSWYDSIRGKRLTELTDGDVARLLRQKMYLEFIVPEATRRLMMNPLAGELFDGEMLEKVSHIPASFWEREPELMKEARMLIQVLLGGEISNPVNELDEVDREEFFDNVQRLKESLGI